METLTNIFENLAAMTAGVVVIAEFVDRFWHLEDWTSQLRAIVLGLALGELGAFFSLGMFADPQVIGSNPPWLAGGLIGLVAGLVGNWAFATPLAKMILEALKIRPKTLKP